MKRRKQNKLMLLQSNAFSCFILDYSSRIPPDAKADLEGFFDRSELARILSTKEKECLVAFRKLNGTTFKTTVLQKFSQPETEGKRSLKTNSLVCFITRPLDSPAALNTGLKFTVVNLIT